MKKLLCVTACLALLTLLLAACGKEANISDKTTVSNTATATPSSEESTTDSALQTSSAPITATPPITTEQRVLQVRNGKLCDTSGQEVVLCGINLGGWLLQETWMCAVNGSECNADSFALLQSRGFDENEIRTLFQSYADNYITEKDIERIAALGLNCLRVPFWYRNFMNEDLTWYHEDPDQNIGFLYLDRVIAWAKAHGLYVILDMHGAPGGQSTDHSTGTIGKNELYTEEKNLKAMEELWVAIAKRYVGNNTVAAYDIMNEPMNNQTSYPNGWAAGSITARTQTIKVYRRMIKAIRTVDPDHILTIEGIWSMTYLPNPQKEGWTNMMYQLHLYDTSVDMIDKRVNEMLTARDKYGVAIYVGEYNNGDENQAYAYRKYRDEAISRTAWTYKTAKGNLGNWSLYWSSTPAADLAVDSYETILQKWGSCLQTEQAHWQENATMKGWLRRYVNK